MHQFGEAAPREENAAGLFYRVVRHRMAWSCALLALLILPRVPSLVQPAGADQALYAYVGTRILDGGLPYRDAWDQKPPAIHFIYAALYGLWPHESVVAAADLLAAAAGALLLLSIGRSLFGSHAAGLTAAALFLLLGDPTFNRLSGVRIRSQCETFIALAIAAAILLAARQRRQDAAVEHRHVASSPRAWLATLLIGSLVGVAVALKYNAIVYAAPVLYVMFQDFDCVRCVVQRTALFAAGALAPIVFLFLIFAAGGALPDVYFATIRYNLEYSGETYTGPLSFVTYLLTFPVQHARVDALWMVGGLGCAILICAWLLNRRRHTLLVPVIWVAAACLSIAINGSRGLPQYFVQAGPALALSAGTAAAVLWPSTWFAPRLRPVARAVVILLVAYGTWRVADFDKIPQNAMHDLAYMTGRISREAHLARYGGQPDAKYSALAVHQLGAYLEARTRRSDPVYIFGFSPGAYLDAGRVSSSRFFWSRPVLVGFNENVRGYGAAGVLEDLQRFPPKFVVLQIHDWAAPPYDSASFFKGNALLGAWLRANYQPVHLMEDYEIWRRRQANDSAPPAE